MTRGKKSNSQEFLPFTPKYTGERYKIGDIIGKGGHAIIVQAEDQDLGRLVALKVLRKGYNSDKSIVNRFLNESRIMAHLSCPGVLPIYEIGQLKDNSYYFAMPLIDGSNLRQYMKRKHKQFSIDYTVDLFSKITQTISIAHSQGIIHRDIKPDNIMIDKRGTVFIVDWGLSKYQDDKNENETSFTNRTNFTLSNFTLDGPLKGTPLYMSPEQIMGLNKRTTTESDIFCLGILFFEMLVKQNPFSHDKSSMQMILKRSGSISAPYQNFLGGRIPMEVRAILSKCLAFLPRERYKDAKQLYQDLSNYMRHLPVKAYKTGRFERLKKFVKRQQKLLLLSFVVFGIILNAFIFQYMGNRSYLASHLAMQKLIADFEVQIDESYEIYLRIKTYQQRLPYITDENSLDKTIRDIVSWKNYNLGLWKVFENKFDYFYGNLARKPYKKTFDKYLTLWLFWLEEEKDNLEKARRIYEKITKFIAKYDIAVASDLAIRLQYFSQEIKKGKDF